MWFQLENRRQSYLTPLFQFVACDSPLTTSKNTRSSLRPCLSTGKWFKNILRLKYWSDVQSMVESSRYLWICFGRRMQTKSQCNLSVLRVPEINTAISRTWIRSLRSRWPTHANVCCVRMWISSPWRHAQIFTRQRNISVSTSWRQGIRLAYSMSSLGRMGLYDGANLIYGDC